jgi:hypothetical protein
MDPVLSQMPLYTITSNFFKIHFNIVFISAPGIPNGFSP